MGKRRKIHEIDHTNDIRYRGVINYQHFRIAAWLFIAAAQISVMITIASKFNPGILASFGTLSTILSFLKELATPLLLIANFAVILSAREGYKKLLIRFGALSAGVFLAYLLLFERYAVGLMALSRTREEARAMLTSIIAGNGFISFNIFLDLFLCTLVMFFLNHQPKKVFVGKKLIIFRLFALLPILYEAVSILLKLLAGLEKISLSPFFFPLLTTKPPFEFIVFIALALFIKRRERKFRKNGKTREEYNEFLGTNANSWHFSVHAAIIMASAAVIDFLIAAVICSIIAGPAYGTEAFQTAAVSAAMFVLRCGIGASVPLLFIAPVMLLFSYNRKPRFPVLDTYIPIAGIILIVLVYFESIYDVIRIGAEMKGIGI